MRLSVSMVMRLPSRNRCTSLPSLTARRPNVDSAISAWRQNSAIWLRISWFFIGGGWGGPGGRGGVWGGVLLFLPPFWGGFLPNKIFPNNAASVPRQQGTPTLRRPPFVWGWLP